MPLIRHPDIHVSDSRKVYEGRIFDLVRESVVLPSGLNQELTIVDHPGAVAIAAVDENGDLLLVRQYRHACGDWLLEVPAGRVEVGEDRLAAAMRELEEETGHRARSWELLREFFAAPGFCSERLSLFIARDLVRVESGAKEKDHDEELDVVRRSPHSLFEADIVDAKTLIAAALLVR
ncbi:MAG: NUDIX hydrolase [Planctomycetes bacterium]|nr:NUDIX hydrolase [Planctomycetota bacterium]